MPDENRISADILDSAIAVHRKLGPGLLEHVYASALSYELTRRGHSVEREVRMHVVYDELTIPNALVVDLIVDKLVLIELKAIDAIADVHRRQVRTYLRASGLRLGLLINFNAARLIEGYERIVRALPDGERAMQ